MKICLVSSQFEHITSGVGTYAKNLIFGLKKSGIEIILLTPDIQKPISEPNFQMLPLKSNYHPQRGTWFLNAVDYAKAIGQLLRNHKLDLIHWLDARESICFGKSELKSIGTIHDYYFAETPGNPLEMSRHYQDWLIRWSYYTISKHAERHALKNLNHLLACSNAVKESICKNYKISENNISRIYIGVEPNGSLKNTSRSKEPKLLFIGQNAQRKGLPALLKALLILSKQKQHFHLSIVGDNPETRKIYTQFQRENSSISHQIELLGNKENAFVRHLLRDGILVMPSQMEGFGLVILEAMQEGSPVIAGNVGGIREVIENDENGFLVNPNDEHEIADRIAKLLSDESTVTKFRANGFETVKTFSINRMTAETINVYERMLKSGPEGI